MPSHQLIRDGCADLPPMTTSTHPTPSDCAQTISVGEQTFLGCIPQFSLMNKSEFSSVIWDTVDLILVSNTHSLLGLPFICASTSFRGRVLATEPVVRFGKVLMEDILDALEQLPPSAPFDAAELSKQTKSSASSLDDLISGPQKVWHSVYSRELITATLSRIQLVAYHEPVDIFGLLTVCGSSAGFGIGSCNWTLTSPTEKIAYLSHTSLLYSHVLPFDDTIFTDADILIVGAINLLGGNQLEKMVSEFRHIVVQTLARGSHVLVPTNPCGVLFDLIETAVHAKENFKGTLLPVFPPDTTEPNVINSNSAATTQTTAHASTSQPSESTDSNHSSATSDRPMAATQGGSSLAGRVARCPIFVVSSQINASLAYANSYGEWLNPEKEALLYTADAPFPFQLLLQSGQLVRLKSLHETPGSKDLGDPHSRCISPTNTPLLLGPNTHLGDMFTSGTPSSTSPTALVDPTTMMALASASTTRGRASGLTGGVWPGSPCVIFASHPSLRFGSVVHLIRALAYGDLRPGGRNTNQAAPLKHSIILVESADYVPRSSLIASPDPSSQLLKHLITPYLGARGDDRFMTTKSPSGVTTCNLSDSATVFWLPMEARLRPEELPQLLSRGGSPKLALCVPAEMASRLPGGLLTGSRAVHFLSCGQKIRIPMLSTRMQPVRVSAQLMQHLRPICLTDQPSMPLDNKACKAPVMKGPSDPRSKPSSLSNLLPAETILTSQKPS
ncbi:unnamed protein product [Dicrocoelium dendriticum]|nr:unnamed protein product [Dicrocoelium dendriticum]